MLIYLLKMIACSAAFYGLYALLFRNEKMLVFNRFYLLTALILSCVIPFITFTVYLSSYIVNGVAQPVKEQHDWVDYAMIILAAISILVSFILLVRFTKNLLRFKKIASGNHKRIAFKGVRIVLLQEPVVPHSFLNTIFLNSDEYQAQHIEKEILEHELAHIRQKHSWDILFVELLQIFYWFNPFIYLYKRSIKINHELLADAAVVKSWITGAVTSIFYFNGQARNLRRHWQAAFIFSLPKKNHHVTKKSQSGYCRPESYAKPAIVSAAGFRVQ
ncbi:hypothetical protein LWM68_26105 [Niabella sp. W65]|nr:hypothetical protein [Niabella sp. W65]MCH7365935.1 hypothetical protein [Niabella sp. W65]ULT41677.1 hypothetical protein KRR40_45015 [Niabella sp. I65]